MSKCLTSSCANLRQCRWILHTLSWLHNLVLQVQTCEKHAKLVKNQLGLIMCKVYSYLRYFRGGKIFFSMLENFFFQIFLLYLHQNLLVRPQRIWFNPHPILSSDLMAAYSAKWINYKICQIDFIWRVFLFVFFLLYSLIWFWIFMIFFKL